MLTAWTFSLLDFVQGLALGCFNEFFDGIVRDNWEDSLLPAA